jgi:cytochrome b561
MQTPPTNVPSMGADPYDASRAERYSAIARGLHWLMAIGFALMWLTGVLVTTIEGVPLFAENDRKGAIRDLHKSMGLTLLALLVLRLGLRFVYPPPRLPAAIPAQEQHHAHLGHAAIYAVIVAACVTGYAIADVHEYGNAYFGIDLPQIFPTTEQVLGFSSTPWAYVLHAALSYGLLALVLGHVTFVVIHRRRHGVQLLPRMLATPAERADGALRRLAWTAGSFAAAVLFFAILAIVTLGPTEEPRDYITTTPFGRVP